jgi:hypothetical protein
MITLRKRNLLFVLSSLGLAALLFSLGLLILHGGPVKAEPEATYTAQIGVMKKPSVATRFVVTNLGSAPTVVRHSYFALDGALVHTETHPLAAGEGRPYDVGRTPGLPRIFYGRLVLSAPQPLQTEVVFPTKMVGGKVTYLNTTRPVTDARVIAHRVGAPDILETRTHITTGMYALFLDDGRWLLEVAPIPGHPTDWIFTDPPAEVIADQAKQRIDLRVTPANGHLIGRVSPITAPTRIVARNKEGIGNETLTRPDGSFDLQVPVGMYDVYARPRDPMWGGLNRNGMLITTTTDIGLVKLRKATAVVTGHVIDVINHTMVGGQRPARIIAWERQGPGWGMAMTGPDGYYELYLAAGRFPTEWVIRVKPPDVPPPNSPYVPEYPKEVVLRQDARREVNFHLLRANGHIVGQAVKPNGAPITDVVGLAHALRHSNPRDRWPRRFNAPMYRGHFTLTVPTTHTLNYDVGVRPDPHSPFAPGYKREVDTPAPGGAIFITIPLHLRNAGIRGALVDARVSPTVTRIVTGVRAHVFAINRPPITLEGDWQSRWVDPRTGLYRMAVHSDTWRLDFRTELRLGPRGVPWVPDPRFRRNPNWHMKTVQAGEVVTANLPVIPLDQKITGTVQIEVRRPGGPVLHPLPYVKVCAEGIDDINRGIRGCLETRMRGNYMLPTTPGHYRVHVLLPQAFIDRGYMVPDVEIANAPEGNVDFKVRKANATVEGYVTISTTHTLTEPRVLVWGWSLNGSRVHTETFLHEIKTGTGVFSPTARYAISVTGPSIWYFGAAYQSGDIVYRTPRQRVEVRANQTHHLDLQLASVEDLLGRLPEPQSVTFDRSLGVTINLENGATLDIPAGAIPADTDDVTVDIYPLALLPEQRFEEVVGFGYAIAAYDADGNQIVERFLENVALTLPYDPALLPPGVDEEDILPAYLSTTSGRWEPPESYYVDTANDEVTLYIDHFTAFGLMAEPSIVTQNYIYLPIILRNAS